MDKIRILNSNDHVAVALQDLNKDEKILNFTLLENIPRGHKICIKSLSKGDLVIKYGSPIGRASEEIKVGAHVHVHNLNTELKETEKYQYQPFESLLDKNPSFYTVDVYERANQKYGIRNELWIIPTVGCVNGTANRICKEFERRYSPSDIDGVYSYGHPYGCSQMGEDHLLTRTILQNICVHPNAGGVLVLGLGCENNQLKSFMNTMPKFDPNRIEFFNAQDVVDEIEEGVRRLKRLYDKMKRDVRVKKPLSVLRIGLKCGGSDGLSGITANPLLGMFSDFLTASGGTTVLTEVPEMFGAETILMNRSKNEAVFQKSVEMIQDFKQYFLDHHQTIYENPSPGNKAGGISTLEDKSLGCIQKGGQNEIVDVLQSSGLIQINGLNLLSGPGNDLVATTLLGASGCQLVLFTTGRGTPFGGFIPTLKISSNTELFNLKRNWIDFNAGELIKENHLETISREFTEYILSVVGGKWVNHEKQKIKEIALFKKGVTL